ncbi:MAG: AraC family transcriptional regulator [Geovibrio sp.]|nr:AraC family transcriptional regulator [Geovibrio sp.]
MNHADYYRIEKAIRFIEQNAGEQPSLDDIAAHLGLSPFHFQRMFTDWAGISPKRFLQCLTIEAAKRLLDESRSVLEASMEAGLSGPSRLHDLFVSVDAVTPGEYKSMGSGLVIKYGFQPTPFGMCMAALTERGLCSLAFADEADAGRETEDLKNRWQNAKLIRDDGTVGETVRRIFKPEKGVI